MTDPKLTACPRCEYCGWDLTEIPCRNPKCYTQPMPAWMGVLAALGVLGFVLMLGFVRLYAQEPAPQPREVRPVPDFTEVPANYLVELDDVTEAVAEFPNWPMGGKPVWRFNGVSIAAVKATLRDVLTWQGRDKERKLKVRIRNASTGKWVNLRDEELTNQIGGWINCEVVCKVGSADF